MPIYEVSFSVVVKGRCRVVAADSHDALRSVLQADHAELRERFVDESDWALRDFSAFEPHLDDDETPADFLEEPEDGEE